VLFGLRSGPRTSAAESKPAAPAHAAAPLWKNRLLYSYGAAYFCIKLIRYSLLFWLPFYLHAEAGFDPVASGYMSTAFEVGGVAGSMGLGWLSDHLGGRRALAAACSLLGLTATLFAYARLGPASAASHVWALAAVGALLYGPDSLLSGAAAQDAGGAARAATAAGFVNGLGSAGALLQGALTVGVQRALGWHALFYVFFGLALIACLCLGPALRIRPVTQT
jgi:OPA family sugar phosphate sensor protein UhpC-like MFS transporter